jgi:hypothetical protein
MSALIIGILQVAYLLFHERILIKMSTWPASSEPELILQGTLLFIGLLIAAIAWLAVSRKRVPGITEKDRDELPKHIQRDLVASVNRQTELISKRKLDSPLR